MHLKTAKATSIEEVVKSISSLSRELLPEEVWAMEILKRDWKPDNFDRLHQSFNIKTAVRSFFSFVDGSTQAMRLAILNARDELGLEPSDERKLQQRLGMAEKVKTAFKYFPRLTNSSFTIDLGRGPYWQHGFLRLVEARNELTHPTRLEHLFPLEIATRIQPTVMWFHLQVDNLLRNFCLDLGLSNEPVNTDKGLPKLEEMPPDACAKSYFDRDLYQQIESGRGKRFRYMTKFFKDILYDLDPAMRALKISDFSVNDQISQFRARNAIRVLYSNMEATTYAAAYWLELEERAGVISLTSAENELVSNVDDTPAYTARIIGLFSQKFGYDFRVPTEGEEWEAVNETKQKRDLITHPGSIEDLHISVSEIVLLLRAFGWWLSASEGGIRLNTEKST